MMVNPAIAADGYTYERTAIEAWLADHTASPITGNPLKHMRIVDNILIRGILNTQSKDA